MSPYANAEDKRLQSRRYYVEHRDEILAKVKRWGEENPLRLKERMRQHKAMHPNVHKEHSRRHYLRHRDEIISKTAERNQRRLREEPEAVRAEQRNKSARRRARMRGSRAEKINPVDIWLRDGGICQICHEPADAADWHLDHRVPLAKGGEHVHVNVQVSHPACNRRKAAS